MELYDYKQYEDVVFFGDIHGEFKEFFHNLNEYLPNRFKEELTPAEKEYKREKRKQKKHKEEIMKRDASIYDKNSENIETTQQKKYGINCCINQHSIIFVCGDCGFGFNKETYYIDLLKKYNEFLKKNDCILLYVRGNHDDPAYFSEKKINFSNMKTIPDYSFILTKDINILCVGGGLSIDRTWRENLEFRKNLHNTGKDKKKFYWEDELPIYDEKKIDEIIKEGYNIDCIVTHTAPSFVEEPETGIDEWIKTDKTIFDDMIKERMALDKLYSKLFQSKQLPKVWSYGHFHKDYKNIIGQTIYKCNNTQYKPTSYKELIKKYIGFDFYDLL